jgi:hypothetical protein
LEFAFNDLIEFLADRYFAIPPYRPTFCFEQGSDFLDSRFILAGIADKYIRHDRVLSKVKHLIREVPEIQTGSLHRVTGGKGLFKITNNYWLGDTTKR